MKMLDIRTRLLLAALLPLVLVSTLLATVFLLARFGDMQAAYDQRNRAVVRQAAVASEYGLFSGNAVQLQALATGALQETDVRWVAILDTRGGLLASAGQADQAFPLPMSALEMQGFASDRRLDWLAQPVFPSAFQLDDLFEKDASGSSAPAVGAGGDGFLASECRQAQA